MPLLPGVLALAAQSVMPGGSRRNLEALAGRLHWDAAVDEPHRLVLGDAQTNGGLLIALPAVAADSLLAALARRDVVGAVIGSLTSGVAGDIAIRP